jgi:sulfur-oxidizing protein SoxY
MKLSRRDFVRHVSLGVFTISVGGLFAPDESEAVKLPGEIQMAKNPKSLTGLEMSHIPQLKVPLVAEDGRVVPIEMTLDHPMEKDHFIESVTFVVLGDPIAGKAQFLYTPYSGKPSFKFQARMDSGTKKVSAIVECNKHGRWVGQATMRIVGGGC